MVNWSVLVSVLMVTTAAIFKIRLIFESKSLSKKSTLIGKQIRVDHTFPIGLIQNELKNNYLALDNHESVAWFYSL